jgi:hypothetical protein
MNRALVWNRLKNARYSNGGVTVSIRDCEALETAINQLERPLQPGTDATEETDRLKMTHEPEDAEAGTSQTTGAKFATAWQWVDGIAWAAIIASTLQEVATALAVVETIMSRPVQYAETLTLPSEGADCVKRPRRAP